MPGFSSSDGPVLHAHKLIPADSLPDSPCDDTDIASYVEAMAQGKQQGLSDLYHCSVEKVYRIASLVLGHYGDAEEVVVDAYRQAWASADQYQPHRGSVLAWLLMITRSRALDARRRFVSRARLFSEVKQRGATPIEPIQPDDWLDVVEVGGKAYYALQQLPQIRRQVLYLSYFKDFSHQQIADYLRIPLGTVKSHIAAAMKVLRQQLAPSGGVGDVN